MRKQEVEELERRLQDKADTMELQERCMESNWEQLSTQRKCREELEQSCRQWEVKQEEAEDGYLHYLSLSNELKQNWFVDFKSGNVKYIVFKDKILKYQIGNQKEKDYVCNECRKMGITDGEMNWSE